MKVYYKNSFQEEEEVKISPFCDSFMQGKGCFTTLQYRKGRALFLKDHISRLRETGEFLNIPLPSLDYPSLLQKLAEVNTMDSMRVKILLFENPAPEALILPAPLIIPKAPLELKISEYVRGNNPLFRYKTLNYYSNILGKETLFTDDKGHILETGFANIFFVKDNTIITPPGTLPLLMGTVRKNLLKLHEWQGFRIKEEIIHVQELKNFSGAFITNAIQGLRPVIKIDDITYSPFLTEALYEKLLEEEGKFTSFSPSSID